MNVILYNLLYLSSACASAMIIVASFPFIIFKDDKQEITGDKEK